MKIGKNFKTKNTAQCTTQHHRQSVFSIEKTENKYVKMAAKSLSSQYATIKYGEH